MQSKTEFQWTLDGQVKQFFHQACKVLNRTLFSLYSWQKKMIGSPWDLCFSSWIISRTNLHACVSRQTHPQKSFISVSGRPDLTTALFYNHIQASNLAFSLILLQKPYSVLLTTCLQTSTVMKSSCFCMPDMCCTNAGACRQQNPIPVLVLCSL